MYLFEHEDFNELLKLVAGKLNMPVAFVEKDYWITYTLFRMKKSGIDDFIFKGGTSLTKGWSLLDRFSEDIDLLFALSGISKDKKRSHLKDVKDTVSNFEGLTFDEEESNSVGHYRTDCYRYNISDNQGLGILLPYIKLEMGYRGGDHPAGKRAIQSYVGKVLEEAGNADIAEDVISFEIDILDHRRTFVEKTFAIYSAFQKNEVTKYFRHYYDIFKLLELDDVRSFLGTPAHIELKKHVKEMSELHFKTKFPEDFELSTSAAFEASEDLIQVLAKALKNGEGLFFRTPPSSEEILAMISKFKSRF